MSNKLVKSLGIYGILNFLPLASRFFLFPIFVNYLQPYDYGILALHGTMMQFFLILVVFGLDGAVARHYFDFAEQRSKLLKYLSTIFVSVILWGGIIILLFQLIGPEIYQLIFSDDLYSFRPFGNLSLGIAFFTAIQGIILAFLRNENNLREYAKIAGGSFVLGVVFETVAIFFVGPNAQNVLIARLLSVAVISAYYIAKFFLKGKIQFDFTLIRYSFKYAVSFMPYTLFGFGYLYLDRIFIENLLSIEKLAIFNTAFIVASVLDIFNNALDQATVPEIFSHLKKGGKKNYEEINKILRLSGVAVLFIASIILALTPVFINNFIPVTYQETLIIIPILLIGFLVRFYYGLNSKFLFYYQSTMKYLPFVNIIATITSFLNFLLIPEFGLVGACITMVLTRLSLLPLAVWLQRKQIRFEYNIKKLHVGFSLAVVLCIIISYFAQNQDFGNILFLVPLVFITSYFGYLIIHNWNVSLISSFKEAIRKI